MVTPSVAIVTINIVTLTVAISDGITADAINRSTRSASSSRLSSPSATATLPPPPNNANVDNTANAMNSLPYMTPFDPLDWRYEMRRDMQEILPNLFLGPYSVSRSRETLLEKGITDLVLVVDPRELTLFRPLFPKDFNYRSITIHDTETSNVITMFPQFREVIDAALMQGGRVLVYCRDGISRSPTFVVAYVMESLNMDYKNALGYVQNRRFCMNPNESWKTQLQVSLATHLQLDSC